MGARRTGRELAVQFLYQRELGHAPVLDEALDVFWGMQEVSPAPGARKFAERIIRGVEENRVALTEDIRSHADNWALDRIAVIDRCILQMALFEMKHCQDIPPVVSINEAIEIAKVYSTDDSGRFVNGILDRVRQDILRPARDAAGG